MKDNKKIEIYVTTWCPFCHRAVALLEKQGLAFTEINVDGDRETRADIQKRSGQRTVPQIFIGDHSVGGCSELEVLIRKNSLKALL